MRAWMTRSITTLQLGTCCWLLASCGEADSGLEPIKLPPPTSLSELFGGVLIDAGGNQVGVNTLESTPLIGILFAAGWCPHCADFIVQLKSFYAELELAGNPFEVVFVSFDNSADDMAAHMTDADMPWLAVPFGSAFESNLKILYNVTSIPTLIVVDSDANTISANGRSEVVLRGAQAYDDWLALSGG